MASVQAHLSLRLWDLRPHRVSWQWGHVMSGCSPVVMRKLREGGGGDRESTLNCGGSSCNARTWEAEAEGSH